MRDLESSQTTRHPLVRVVRLFYILRLGFERLALRCSPLSSLENLVLLLPSAAPLPLHCTTLRTLYYTAVSLAPMRDRASTSPPAYSHGHVHAPSSAGSGSGANHSHSSSSSNSNSSSNTSSNSAAKRVAGEQLFRRLGLRAFQSPQQQQQQQQQQQGKEQGEQQGSARLPGGPVCSAVLACALLVLYL